MRITAHGWNRNAGDTLIFDQPIKKDTTQPYGSTKPRVVTLDRRPGEVELRVGPSTLTMGGRYLISARFSDEDIARLFLEAHPEFRSVVEAIYGKPDVGEAAAE